MSITAEKKQELIKKFAVHENETGSPEDQIAILTERIRNLTEHIKANKKTFTQEEVLSEWLIKEESF